MEKMRNLIDFETEFNMGFELKIEFTNKHSDIVIT